MNEEIIIINGVNVAGCEFYFEDNGVIAPDGTPERANICTSPENSCKNNDSCYCNKNCYKQLKRLQAENERLKRKKEIASEVAKDNSIFEDRYYELKEENERLKESNLQLQTIDMEIDRNNKYRKALEEIRDIAKIAFIVCDDECGNANKFAEIQDKVNEVLK